LIIKGLDLKKYNQAPAWSSNVSKPSWSLVVPIVLQEILSGDFNKNISSERCLENVLNQAKNGSIIVFHDSLKAEKHLRFVLPKILEYFDNQGFRFERIFF
jgi:hypothetical protein